MAGCQPRRRARYFFFLCTKRTVSPVARGNARINKRCGQELALGGEGSSRVCDSGNGITNMTTTIRYASKTDRDAAFATGMTDGMEMSYKLLDGVLGEM